MSASDTTNPFATGTADWQRYEDQLALQQRQKRLQESAVAKEESE